MVWLWRSQAPLFIRRDFAIGVESDLTAALWQDIQRGFNLFLRPFPRTSRRPTQLMAIERGWAKAGRMVPAVDRKRGRIGCALHQSVKIRASIGRERLPAYHPRMSWIVRLRLHGQDGAEPGLSRPCSKLLIARGRAVPVARQTGGAVTEIFFVQLQCRATVQRS